MFSVRQKKEISEAVQKILRDTNHPELPETEIQFQLRVDGANWLSWGVIQNNGYYTKDDPPSINPHNEAQDPANKIS